MVNAIAKLNETEIQGLKNWHLILRVDSVQFDQVSGFKYKQLIAHCSRRGCEIKIPVFPFCTKDYNDMLSFLQNLSLNYSIKDLLQPAKIDCDYLMNNNKEIVSLKKHKLYYGLNSRYQYFTYDKNYDTTIHDVTFKMLDTDSIVKLEDGFYTVEDFCIDNLDDAGSTIGLFVIIRNDNGLKIKVPSIVRMNVEIFPSVSEYKAFNFISMFCAAEEANVKFLEDEKEAQRRSEQYAQIAKTYGKSYADKLKDYVYTDKFMNLAKKYGPQLALLMFKGEVKIGWTYQMVADALGEPDEVVDSDYGVMYTELWTYDRNRLYLYFSNGKLANITHIQ